MVNSMIITADDNVVVVTTAISAGDTINYILNGEELHITAKEDIPIYHKAAVCDIQTGEDVIKYANIIGVAQTLIKKGCHVHCHNVESKEKEI